MRIALISSNNLPINRNVKKGSEILFRTLINGLSKKTKVYDLKIIAFASGNSELPVKIKSVAQEATSQDSTIPQEKIIMFELALLSKAFSLQDEFDLYNIHIGDGDLVLPFAQFIKKPIIVSMHHIFDKKYIKKYFSLFKNLPNVYFISLSNAQRNFFPKLNFINTIYNGVDTQLFIMDPIGGNNILWSGRGIPIKGLDAAIYVANQLGKKTDLVIIRKTEHKEWLNSTLNLINSLKIKDKVTVTFDLIQEKLVEKYQKSRLFIFPTLLEEACPLSALESMSCGTPVVAYAKGAIPEIIRDGVTGFIVNSSDNDIRGNWIIKKTGIEGLIDAVERIYNMPNSEYLTLRRACRKHIEKTYTLEKMVEKYFQTYQKAIKIYNDKKL